MTRSILWFSEIRNEHAPLVGGKGLHLGLMSAIGLPVPPGFVITQDAYQHAQESRGIGSELRSELLAAYEQLGRGLVAVRSSASGEDGSEFSFAGQQETILGVDGDEALVAAVERCWRSLLSERATAYRQAQPAAEATIAMAVVVQRLVPSEISGVLFTQDPLDGTGRNLLVEAAAGLGEAVVSGRVMPDRYHVERASGRIVDQQVSRKTEMLTASGWQAIPESQQQRPCLRSEQLAALCALAERIETYYGEPRDVEWAFAKGEFYILQARPITAAGAAEIEEVRRNEIERVRRMAAGREQIWARYNLAEVLPAPTPLTWSIVKRFMSGRGAFGQMFRDLGYDPDPQLDHDGFLDLIGGRPYVNLDREPTLYFRDFPYGYDFAAIREQPTLGSYPKLTTVPSRKTTRFWWRLPGIAWRMITATRRIGQAIQREATRLTKETYPAFVALVNEDRQDDLTELEDETLLGKIIDWTLYINHFGRHSLTPGVLAATALAELEQLLSAAGVAEASAASRRLVMGVRPPPETDLAGALQRLARGEMTREAFLARFGHRGPQEMELAQPRWSEAPETLPRGAPSVASHESQLEQLSDIVDFQKHSALRPRLEKALGHARTYMALRESSKHYLMLGFERLRAVFREIGRRTGVGDDIFYVSLEDLEGKTALPDRDALLPKVKEAKRHRKLLLALPAPPVLFSDDLEALGRPVPVVGAAEWRATPLSFGDFEGPALVLEQPIPADSVVPGFVLVCPSTDPAWVPLFLKAGALVMETGGVLSHGAIVAREFGIPAVAGIANVYRQLQTGQRLRVDGTTGRVHVFPP